MPETKKRKEGQRQRAEIVVFEQLSLLDKCAFHKKQIIWKSSMRCGVFQNLDCSPVYIATAAPFNVQFVEFLPLLVSYILSASKSCQKFITTLQPNV